MVQLWLEQSVAISVISLIKILLFSFFAENNKTGPKRVKKNAKRIFEIGWQTQEIGFKKHFVHQMDGDQRFWNRWCRFLSLYFSTSFDWFGEHRCRSSRRGRGYQNPKKPKYR